MNKLIQTAQSTEFGKKHSFRIIRSYEQFKKQIPISDYEGLKPYIQRMMHGEKDILWTGRVKWFSKSSGTTSDKSKFIPVSKENLFGNHIKGSWDTLANMYHHTPDLPLFKCKSLVMGGSLEKFEPYPNTRIGDISAIMIHHMPGIGRPFYLPSFEVALMSDWEKKIELTAREVLEEKNLVMFGGVPTWNLVLFRKILEYTGASNLLEVWPNLKAYIHGGVGFEPYRQQFKQLIPSDDFIYMEVYNASEGYFAVSHHPGDSDLLLLIDNGIFYEFIPMSDYTMGNMDSAVPLTGVKKDINYAMVISSNSGLWRYVPGDTVRFTSLDPYKIKIVGRTQQFINAFGEEVVVANTDQALAMTCKDHQVVVKDYTVAPIYIGIMGQGGHQWLIEFEKSPKNPEAFAVDLDTNLQKLNSDYEAKRSNNLALYPLQVQSVPSGTFFNWMKSKGKLGGQNKVPRLSNHRKVVEDILDFVQQAR
jgi:hypothetical protein